MKSEKEDIIIKELRKITGAGYIEIKKVYHETDCDFDKSVKILLNNVGARSI